MRLYTFINFYLSPIQQGIQTAHIVHELYTKYMYKSSTEPLQIHEWATKHKTIIVLNAGVDQQIQELMDIFAKYHFAFTEFREDEGLCNARTGCGIVLPEKIYGAERKFDKDTKEVYYQHIDKDSFVHTNYFEGDEYFDLIDIIKSKRLA